ncbi:hypothetical protein BC962_2976 [Gillisia mitskevichiae]|uniref:Carboxypeptidase-like protein n=1 Tax=Gillisia mitskevichiae TaxID=270921 RepID=A0A495P0V0_9FLAO|nr:hypothetical protein [Gillisia mitskevichiae]RKS43420.1 hypothetical protein BC962_2976 [Gillisia mitskevichiae]
MKKLTYLLVAFLIVHFSYAQTNDRIKISGTIEVPVGEDPQGISIFNLNSQEGTISNSNGEFLIDVAENDSIKVFAVQFQEFLIVIDKRVLESKKLNIYVNELVNRLPEVLVSPYDLTGNLNADVEELEVIQMPVNIKIGIPDGEYANVENVANFGKAPKNQALAFNQTKLVNGINFVNLFKVLLISNKKNDISNPYSNSYKEIDVELRQLYNDRFFKDNFNIDLDNIPDFILYADRNGLDEEMLRKGNELDLIDFLMEQSKKYKKQLNKN